MPRLNGYGLEWISRVCRRWRLCPRLPCRSRVSPLLPAPHSLVARHTASRALLLNVIKGFSGIVKLDDIKR